MNYPKIFNVFFKKDMENYRRFMKNDIFNYSHSYPYRKVRIENGERLEENKEGAVLAFLHFGSFFLSGIALIKLLGLKYTAIASSVNLQYLTDEEKSYWKSVYEKINGLYSRDLFFTSENPRKFVQWLNKDNYLGVALDVIEKGRLNKVALFNFLGEDVFFQTSPARLAKLTNKPLVGMTIRYSPILQSHTLFIGKPHKVINEKSSIQEILFEMEEIVNKHRYQFFHDIHNTFQNIDFKDVRIST